MDSSATPAHSGGRRFCGGRRPAPQRLNVTVANRCHRVSATRACRGFRSASCQTRADVRPSTSMRRAIGAVLAGGLCVVTTACRDDSGGDTAAFCGQVNEHLDELRAIPQTERGRRPLIALWKDVGNDAPLSIEPDWQAHVLLYETAVGSRDPRRRGQGGGGLRPRRSRRNGPRSRSRRGSTTTAASTGDRSRRSFPQVTTTTLAPGDTAPTTLAGAADDDCRRLNGPAPTRSADLAATQDRPGRRGRTPWPARRRTNGRGRCRSGSARTSGRSAGP